MTSCVFGEWTIQHTNAPGAPNYLSFNSVGLKRYNVIVSRNEPGKIIDFLTSTMETAYKNGWISLTPNPFVADTPIIISEDDMPYARRTDFVGDTIIYIGEAAVGSADASAVWRIRRLTLTLPDSDVTEEWADGNSQFDNVWNNRAGLTYS